MPMLPAMMRGPAGTGPCLTLAALPGVDGMGFSDHQLVNRGGAGQGQAGLPGTPGRGKAVATGLGQPSEPRVKGTRGERRPLRQL